VATGPASAIRAGIDSVGARLKGASVISDLILSETAQRHQKDSGDQSNFVVEFHEQISILDFERQ
jgi:hypothetical protein